MKDNSDTSVKDLLDLSELLTKLAERFALNTDDEKSLILYGTVLDSAYKLRVTAEKLWSDATEQNCSNKLPTQLSGTTRSSM
jgi:hypothetical protein